jgi:hypothetical protein
MPYLNKFSGILYLSWTGDKKQQPYSWSRTAENTSPKHPTLIQMGSLSNNCVSCKMDKEQEEFIVQRSHTQNTSPLREPPARDLLQES